MISGRDREPCEEVVRKTLDFRRPHVIRDSREYESALAEIADLMGADPVSGSADAERLEFLAVLVEHYEEKNFPMPGKLRPRDAVDFMLEQKGLARSDLHELMGGRSRVSEFFAGRRELSKTQITALIRFLGIPAEILLG